MTTEDALLAAVLAAPDDDLPRLVLADYWDEHGKAKVATRIRRQIANGKTFKINGLAGFKYDTVTGIDGAGFLVTWRRGFVEEIRCCAAWWLAHGDALTARHPVRRVKLTTRPNIVPVSAAVVTESGWRLAGDPLEDWLLPYAAGFRAQDIPRLVCEQRWKGVSFELPPPPAMYVRTGGTFLEPVWTEVAGNDDVTQNAAWRAAEAEARAARNDAADEGEPPRGV